MKKILVTLMMVFGLSVAAFADVKLVPEDKFNRIASTFEDKPYMQPQIAYVADTWEDIYEKTGVDKYDWKEGNSVYCDCAVHQRLVIIKFEVGGGLWWVCYEYPGDSSLVVYYADVY